MLYGTILLLAVGFFIIVGMVFLFADTLSLPGAKCVGVVEINNEITTQSIPVSIFADGVPGSADIASAVESLNKRDDVGAVVFVINSPGGSTVASREIYQSMKDLKKPKVAYFREVAASGGYYISTATDYIVSEPGALTGSIGVVMTTAEMSGLFEKLGFNMTNVVSGTYKDIGAPNRPMTDAEKAILQALVDEDYQNFRSVILEGRKGRLNVEKFNEVADGRVLSGRQAKEVGLVDQLGTRKDAITKAAELGNMTGEPRICKIKITPGSGDGSLLGMDSFFRKLGMDSGVKKVTLSFE
jgi:protease-4